MMMMNRHHSIRHYGPRVFQANVGRGGPAHDIALHLAHEAGCHVVLLQEPWTRATPGRRLTKTHPGYKTYIPIDNWSERPRVMTYIRRDAGYRVLQPTAGMSRDLLQVILQQPGRPGLVIWNVYNAPTGSEGAGEGLAKLLQIRPGPFTTIAGDFNASHRDWDPARRTTAEGAGLADWAARHNLRLASQPGVSTHDAGGVLDLVFTDDPTAQAEVIDSLDTTSDHRTLQYTLGGPSPPRPLPGRLRLGATWDRDKFLTLLAHAAQPTSENIDTETEDLAQSIHSALAGSTQRTLPRSRGAKWWNSECQLAATAYRQARRTGPAGDERRMLQRAVRRAKRAFWRKTVESADALPKLYKITNWHRNSPQYPSPPLLEPDGNLATSAADKQRLLHNVLLSRHEGATDIPLDSPAVPRRALEWTPLRMPEAFAATCQAQSTTPGQDELPAQVIREAWPIIGSRVFQLFNKCLQEGYHPAHFKAARIVVIPKAGDRNRALPESYRPIALLSCLGKGLERLIARRIVFLALQYEILAEDQCGATSRRAATDLTTALCADVEKIWSQNMVAGMVTLDVKGAFDGVLPGHLILRLRQQGWPPPVLAWTQSFLSGRTASISIDGETSQPRELHCGLPQGSPVSPILFLLYIQPALNLPLNPGCRARYCYADDINFLAAARTMEGCRLLLQAIVDEVWEWGQPNGVHFSEMKTELQYFTPGKRRHQTAGSIQAGGHQIMPKPDKGPDSTTRWLGVHFDQHLTFAQHISLACAKAKKIASHVKSLNGTTYGASTALLRQTVQSCALASLFYGSETWYTKRIRGSSMAQIQKTINAAARAVLPVYRTTPIAALLREIGWPPAPAWLNLAHDRLAARIASTDPQHPLRTRWDSSTMRRIRCRQEIQMGSPTYTPPWGPLDRDKSRVEIAAIGRKAGPDAFSSWAAKRPTLDLTVYSDGSLRDGQAGAGFYITRGPTATTVIKEASIGLGNTATVYDAEIIAATSGLAAALENPMARFATNVTVCLDNEEAAIRLHTGLATRTSAPEILTFNKLKASWPLRPLATPGKHGTVEVRWVPGHQSIHGNEAADRLANAGCSLPPCRTAVSYSAALTLAEDRFHKALQDYWAANAPTRYKDMGIKTGRTMPKELNLPRSTLGRLLAARSGHGDFQDYHVRFNHEDAVLHCSCGEAKSPDHFYYCRAGQSRARLRAPGRQGTQRAIRWLLSSSAGAARFASWCQSSKFYTDICPLPMGPRPA